MTNISHKLKNKYEKKNDNNQKRTDEKKKKKRKKSTHSKGLVLCSH